MITFLGPQKSPAASDLRNPGAYLSTGKATRMDESFLTEWVKIAVWPTKEAGTSPPQAQGARARSQQVSPFPAGCLTCIPALAESPRGPGLAVSGWG